MDINTLLPFKSGSAEATESFAAQLAQALPRGTVIALDGNLGAGKTVFARGFARGLGITESVSSPTYTIIQEYPLNDGGYLYHMDLYRISDSVSALGFGIDEYLNADDSYSLVEWPERISDILPPGTIFLKINRLSDTERIFERFYRVDKSHSKKVGGTGLGLSIVKHVCACHNATIRVKSKVGKGTTIYVTFPNNVNN